MGMNLRFGYGSCNFMQLHIWELMMPQIVSEKPKQTLDQVKIKSCRTCQTLSWPTLLADQVENITSVSLRVSQHGEQIFITTKKTGKPQRPCQALNQLHRCSNRIKVKMGRKPNLPLGWRIEKKNLCSFVCLYFFWKGRKQESNKLKTSYNFTCLGYTPVLLL